MAPEWMEVVSPASVPMGSVGSPENGETSMGEGISVLDAIDAPSNSDGTP